MRTVTEKVLYQKIDKYYFKNPEGRICKYKQFCIRKNCKTESSYNYQNLKPKYCNKHKKENMVNVKRGHKLCKICKSSYKTKCISKQCKYTIEKYPIQSAYMKLKTIKYLKEIKKEFYLCRLCGIIVNKDHFFTDEHIKKFNDNIQIDITKSFEYSFISIKCTFHETKYNYFYTDLYFKKHIKDLILKNVDNKKYYKSYILKKNMITFNNKDDKIHFSEKFNSDTIISDIDNIENLEKNENYMKPYLIKTSNKDYKYDLTKMYEDINKINQYESGNSIKTVSNIECYFKLSQCKLIKGSKYDFKSIPEIFYKSKIINIIKNEDNKCFIYCYIRKLLNQITKHKERVSSKDKHLCSQIEDKLRYNFDNVKIKDLDKIENLLEVNIFVYTCNKNLQDKYCLYKSNKKYDKNLDLLLFNNHYMIINKIHKFFYPTKNNIYFCRNCFISYHSKDKFEEHSSFCQTNKTMLMLPSKNKYTKFKNIQNTIQTTFIAYADIESHMIKKDKFEEHKHLKSGYLLDCLDQKYSKKCQVFNNLEQFRDSLIDELDYVEKINDKFDYPINMSTFNQKVFNEVTHCKWCNYDFSEKYNKRYITLFEKVDKYKLKRIIDDKNNDINKETRDNLIKYYNSLNEHGEVKMNYKQNHNAGRYYSTKFGLQNMYNIVRTSIIHKDMLDLDFVNSMVTIIIYLAEKHKLKIPNIKKYAKDRENILKQINEDRMTAKKVIITILNGGFQKEYNKNTHINNFLKEIENESKMLHDYFYEIDKRIDDKKIENYKGKSFSRILQNHENELLMTLYDYLTFNKYKIMTLIFDGILVLPGKSILITDIEEYIFKKTEIPMKLSVKKIKDHFTKFGESNIDLKEFKKNYNIKTYVNKKVIHHNHMIKNNNIIDYICSHCNMQIKNLKELVVFFHNSKGYDNTYMVDIFSKIKGVKITCLADNKQKFKLLTIKIPNKKYKIKIVDSLSFLQSNLNSLSKELDNDLKILTKQEFVDKFEFINKKLENFPYDYMNPNTLHETKLPSKKYFYNKLTIRDITDEQYENVIKFYKNMQFKNLDDYLTAYLKSDITLLADIFNNFRKTIFNQFQIDPAKYISAPSLSKDIALKESKVKIENIQDITIFNFIKNSIMGGLSDSINANIQLNNDNQTIAYLDISSQYPYEMTKPLPISDYKFVTEFDENKYGENKQFGCILLCDIKTTDKIENDHLFKQCPPLVSRTKVTDENLSQFQLNMIKEKMKNKNKYFINNIKYDSLSEKIIPNLGDDSNVYLNHEMYQMFVEFGYNIKIKKILEYKHEPFLKDYIQLLYSKKKEFSLQKKVAYSFIYKILMNSLYGSFLTDKTRFKDVQIVTSKRQALKLSNKPYYHSMNIVNENLVIIEMNKKKCVFDSPILIGSQILFGSKVNLYNYMYNIFPRLFGKENIAFSCRDTDSVMLKIDNLKYDNYLKILKENQHLFGKQMGLMENEINGNINQIISLRSKCYSIQPLSDINKKNDTNHKLRKMKGINQSYKIRNHTHKLYQKILFENYKKEKAEYYQITIKNNKLVTELVEKEDINLFNDKRHQINDLESKPHKINL